MPAPKPEKKLKRKFQFDFNALKSGKYRDFILAEKYKVTKKINDKRKEKNIICR